MGETNPTTRDDIDEFERELEAFERGLRESRSEYHERLLAHVRTLSVPAIDSNPDARWAPLWAVCLKQEEQISNLQTRVSALETALQETDDD